MLCFKLKGGTTYELRIFTFFYLTEYHPNITVNIWTHQLNGSAVNVTVDVSPDPDNITSYFLEASYASTGIRDIPTLIQETVPSEKVIKV